MGEILTIPAGGSFLDQLAGGILTEAGPEPLALTDLTVFLPTRRAGRGLRDAVLRVDGGRARLLPRILALADLDPDDQAFEPGLAEADLTIPPAVSGLRRQMLLMRLVQKRTKQSPDLAWPLAAALAALLDEMQTEGIGFDQLPALAPLELAGHWQQTTDFLDIIGTVWPMILAERGWIDAADRRNRLLDRQADAWARHPPHTPVIAAGMTGTVPAVARLLGVIADMPHGRLVLPGLDLDMPAAEWDNLPHGHPQAPLKQLLARLNRSRDEVGLWPQSDIARFAARRSLWSLALAPAAGSARWIGAGERDIAPALNGVAVMEAETPQAEAEAIALAMRAALDQPGQDAALVTSDRNLARRVAAALRRWNLDVDDSAGQPLADTPVGLFIRLVADLGVGEADPVSLVALGQHPLFTAGAAPGRQRSMLRRFEKDCLRGPAPAPGWDGLRSLLPADKPESRADYDALIDDLALRCAPLFDLMQAGEAPLAQLLDAHLAVAEALAESDNLPGAQRLWRGEDGTAIAALFAGLIEAAADAEDPWPAHGYAGWLTTVLAGASLRPRYGRDPRLHIWGLVESRLQSADLMILGGLNDGVWPPVPPPDPWLSRPMRLALALPPPEARRAESAHDFWLHVNAPRLLLSRSRRDDQGPTAPSPWLARLGTLLAAGLPPDLARKPPALPELVVMRGGDPAYWPDFAGQIDAPAHVTPIDPPRPCPPLASRPRRFSVSDIELLRNNPYGLYARRILKLEPLQALAEDPTLADLGTLMHDALSDFIAKRRQGRLRDRDRVALIADIDRRLSTWPSPALRAIWTSKLHAMADAFIAHENDSRADGYQPELLEHKLSLPLALPGGDVVLTARLDRLDRARTDGCRLIDYKTGAAPSGGAIADGVALQLALEAMILQDGGDGGRRWPVSELAYWKISTDGIKETGYGRDSAKHNLPALIDTTRASLIALLNYFDKPDSCYIVKPHPAWVIRHDAYAHLAREAEWSVLDSGEDE